MYIHSHKNTQISKNVQCSIVYNEENRKPNWQSGSSGRAPAWQAQGPTSILKKKKKGGGEREEEEEIRCLENKRISNIENCPHET
jgi:hypothetical protein